MKIAKSIKLLFLSSALISTVLIGNTITKNNNKNLNSAIKSQENNNQEIQETISKSEDSIQEVKNQENISLKKDYTKIIDEDIVLGDRNNKNYIIMYSSFTCPHCSDFYTKTFPIIKQNLIEKNKVSFVNRAFLSDKVALSATLLAKCNTDNYYKMTEVLFEMPESWVMRNDYTTVLKQIAGLSGITPEKFNECLQNYDLQNKLVHQQKEAVEQLNITGIPLFIINGKVHHGALTYNKINELINKE